MLEMESKSNVRVAVSVRPLNERERENGEERVVWTRSKEVRVLNPESRNEKLFKFDHTFCSEPSTEESEPNTQVRLKLSNISDNISLTTFSSRLRKK